MVAIRDLKCSMDIAEMAALGKFEQEFMVYGCCYQEKGKLFYQISGQSMDIYRFQETCMKQNCYTTPVMAWLNRVAVPSGMQEEYFFQTKVELAKKLQQAYRNEIFLQFTHLAETENSDVAAELFRDLQSKMMGCFDRDVMQLVSGLILYAHQQKKLTVETYNDLQRWLMYLYEQMEDDVVIIKAFRRTYFGFGYQENGKKRYYANASESEARKWREMLIIKGRFCTPMVQKTYYYHNQPDLGKVRKEFLQQIAQWMDEEYWHYLITIAQLPTVIDVDRYQQLLAQAEERDWTVMQQHLQYYQCLWQLSLKR